MPTNKNALLRYIVLDRCFRNRYGKYNIKKLTEEVTKALKDINHKDAHISIRTIQNDIKFMKSLNGHDAPVEIYREGRAVYYRYSDTSFSIFNQPLTGDELSAVKEIYNIISGISGRIEYEFLKNVLLRLDKRIGEDFDNEKTVISYEENKFLKNKDGLGLLLMSIKSRQPLDITYKPFDDKPRKFTIHPYFLKQYNNRWFLFGLDELSKSEGIHPVNLAIDRIEKIENSGVEYIANTDIDFAKYFEHIIGVTKPAGEYVMKIKFAVSPELKPYLETKPIHHSQRAFKKKGELYYSSIQVIPNYEMYSMFLSFGADMQLLSPLEIVERIKKMIILP